MYIIDKYKDYYDFHSNIYGVDKKIVYDRRGSIELTTDLILSKFKNEYDRYSYFSHYRKHHDSLHILEVGFKQYLIRYYDIIIEEKKYSKYSYGEKIIKDYKVDILRIFDDHKHYFNKEMTLTDANIDYLIQRKYYNQYKKHYMKLFDLISFDDLGYNKDKVFENPILAKTDITHLIDSSEIWKELSMYISSKYNDKTVDIVNTDKDKIIIHGFDTKISFRNPIKTSELK